MNVAKKAISAKIDDRLLKETDRLAHRLKVPRNRALEEGLALWGEKKRRELLAQEFRRASLAVRKESLANAREWEVALNDGLGDE